MTTYASLSTSPFYHIVSASNPERAACGLDIWGPKDVRSCSEDERDRYERTTTIPPNKRRMCLDCMRLDKRVGERKMAQKPSVITKKRTVINPKHYDMTINGQPIQVVDIIEARFAEDAHLSQACKYLLRAGHKTDSSYTKDVGKCLWWCAKALMFNKATHIELPPGAPVR